MHRILTGQVLLILCCITYLIWWYRGFRPGVNVSRVGGMNGALLLITAVLGIAGIMFSVLSDGKETAPAKISPQLITAAGIAAYIAFLLITSFLFDRVVTTELILIVGWTALEMQVINRLNAMGNLSDGQFLVMCAIIAAAFVISMVLYVAYYRMDEMRAFYMAMVPLVTEALSMGILVCLARQ